MRRSTRSAVAVISAFVALVTVFVGFRLVQGSLDYTLYEHTPPGYLSCYRDYNGDTFTDLFMALDMNPVNYDGPCHSVESWVQHNFTETYPVAVCACGLYVGFPVGTVSFDVLYDDTLNLAPEVADAGTGLDDNPDANAGSTTFNGPGHDLGDGFDCSSSGLAFPKGDKNPASGPGNGDAFLSCSSLTGPFRLGDDEDWGTIAVITFTAQGTAGLDTLTIANGVLRYTDGSEMGTCNPAAEVPIPCEIGFDDKEGPPTPTPTNTPKPTATVTPTASPSPTSPPGVGGAVRLPPAIVAAEADATSTVSEPSSPAYATLAGAAAAGTLALSACGWYAMNRRRGQRS